MAIEDDFSVTVAGDIRHDSGTTNYTVLELHRYLQDLADDQQASGNDLIDITTETPSDRSTDTIITLAVPFNIDDDAAEFLYAGSIEQDGGDTKYRGLQVLGAVNTAATQLMVIQDGDIYQFTPTPATPFWGTQASPYNGGGTVLMRVLIKSRVNGCDIDNENVRVQARHYGDTYDFFVTGLGDGESVAAIGTTPDPQNDTAQGTVTTYTHVVNSGGTANAPTGGFQEIDLNNGNGLREYYSKWTFGADTSGDGLKGMWEYLKDLSGNGTTKTNDSLNGELFVGISHEIVYDGGSGTFTEREDVVWGTDITYDTLVSGPFTPGNYVTIGNNGAAGRVMDDDGSATLIVALEDISITLLTGDVITEFPGPGAGATSTTAAINVTILDNDRLGGSGLLLAHDDNTGTGDLYIQLVSGDPPVDNLPLLGGTSNATALVNVTVNVKTLPKIFLGSYTGNLIGAYGIGVDEGDVTTNDSLEDLANVTQTPPNNVVFSVTGMVVGQDYCLVGPRATGLLEKDQDTINGTLTDNVTGTVTTTGAIPSDTPTAGTIRVQDDNGVYTRQPYDSYATPVYTLTANYQGSDDADATTGNEIFISYIDLLATATSESFTSVFLAERDLLVRVRDGGITPIKTFEAPAQLTASGGTIAVIRTTDA